MPTVADQLAGWSRRSPRRCRPTRTRSARNGRWIAGSEATVTIARAAGPAEAARLANDETSGLAAGIVTEDADARPPISWPPTPERVHSGTRRRGCSTGYRLLSVPETGINIDRVPVRAGR